jgi:hypothetical protein
MLRNLRLVIIMAALLLATAVAQSDQSIVGTWIQDAQDTRWTFRADGTGFLERGQPKTTARFNWQFQGETLQVSTAGTSIPYAVIQNDGQTLVIRNERVAQVYQLRRD